MATISSRKPRGSQESARSPPIGNEAREEAKPQHAEAPGQEAEKAVVRQPVRRWWPSGCLPDRQAKTRPWR